LRAEHKLYEILAANLRQQATRWTNSCDSEEWAADLPFSGTELPRSEQGEMPCGELTWTRIGHDQALGANLTERFSS
jgi:hypothetical protein